MHHRDSRPVSELMQWAKLNDATFHDIKPAAAGEGRGSGLLATRDLSGDERDEPLLVVPRDLVLSKETVQLLAKSDKDLRELLEALGEFIQTSRGAILTFLLYVLTMNRARASGRHLGSLTPFNDYVRFLPDELLPTFWSPSEVGLLAGTSLHAALEAKQASLSREYDRLREITEDIRWCQDLWFSTGENDLKLEDWLTVDAMYRSRALEFPGIGDAMVPCVDMANHASGDFTSAIYETDGDGNAVLLLRPAIKVKSGEEVTITYGDAKGACEMLFSYGFIEEGMPDARELFLPLTMMDDDPLGPAKNHVAKKGIAPGVKIYRDQATSELNWHSEYVYLMVLNQEDGLDFAVAMDVEGNRELQMTWHDEAINITPTALSKFITETLPKDEYWDVWHLRATVTVLERIKEQLQALETVNVEDIISFEGSAIREAVKPLALKLRELERHLLSGAVASLEALVEVMMGNEKVVEWFTMQQSDRAAANEQSRADEDEDEDFT